MEKFEDDFVELAAVTRSECVQYTTIHNISPFLYKRTLIVTDMHPYIKGNYYQISYTSFWN